MLTMTKYSEWVAAMTNSDEPFDPDLLDIAEANRAFANRRFCCP